MPTEEEILEYADTGAFLAQFPKQWPSITQEHATEVLERHGVIPASEDDPRSPSKRADDEREAAEELTEPIVEEGESKLPKLEDRIVELDKNGTTPSEIREILSREYGQEVSPQKVGAVIRSAEAKT